MSRYIFAVLLLTLIYALALASFDPLDLAAGAAISAVLIFVFRDFVFAEGGAGTGLTRRILAFFPFAAAVLLNIVTGSWKVALVVIGLRPLRQTGIVAVPIGERTQNGIAVSALVTTLSPGTFLVDVDERRGVMLIHTIDASEPDRVRQQHQRFYSRYQKKLFP